MQHPARVGERRPFDKIASLSTRTPAGNVLTCIELNKAADRAPARATCGSCYNDRRSVTRSDAVLQAGNDESSQAFQFGSIMVVDAMSTMNPTSLEQSRFNMVEQQI